MSDTNQQETRFEGPRPLVFLILLGAALFLTSLSAYDLWPADEPRFGQVPREMMQSGDYISPTINGEPYHEKPPLLFWLVALFSAPFDNVSETSARLPSALSALVSLAFTYLLARRLFGPRVAFWSGLILITCIRFWWQARTVQIDMLLTACMTAALYALWRWDEERRGRWLLLLYGATAAGMLAKGPPALVFPLLFIFAYYWKNKEGRRATHWLIGTLAVIAITAAWYIPARMLSAETAAHAMESGVGENLLRNTIGRFFLGISKAQPPWYYITTLPVDWMPWTLFAPWILLYTWRRRRESKMMRFLLCWIVPALIFFTISIGKRSIYILPLFPAMAILVALAVLQFCEIVPQRRHMLIARIWAALLLLLALVLAAPMLATIPFEDQDLRLQPHPELLFMITFAIAGAIVLLKRGRRLVRTQLPMLVAGQAIVLFALVPPFVLPIVNHFKSARGVTEPVRVLSERGADFDVYSLGFSREEFIFYGKHFHTPLFTSLIGMEQMTTSEMIEAAQWQREARKVIFEAVEDIEVENLEQTTQEERARLREAIEQAVAREMEAIPQLRDFEREIVKALDDFATTFNNSRPVFAFVQDEDWKWMLPLFTEVPPFAVARHQHVGRREVLLLANEAAYNLMN